MIKHSKRTGNLPEASESGRRKPGFNPGKFACRVLSFPTDSSLFLLCHFGSPRLLPEQGIGISQGVGRDAKTGQHPVGRTELLVRGLSHTPSHFNELEGRERHGKTTGLELRPGFKFCFRHYQMMSTAWNWCGYTWQWTLGRPQNQWTISLSTKAAASPSPSKLCVSDSWSPPQFSLKPEPSCTLDWLPVGLDPSCWVLPGQRSLCGGILPPTYLVFLLSVFLRIRIGLVRACPSRWGCRSLPGSLPALCSRFPLSLLL